MNTIYLWNSNAISGLVNLEEINMQHLDMQGIIASSISSLKKLKHFNLAHNSLSGSLPDGNVWTGMT